MRNEHTWKEKTEDGGKREVRGVKFGGLWRVQSKLQTETAWTYHDPPRLEDLRELREVLFRKYQRRRASYEDVTGVEKMITLRESQTD